MREPSLDRVPDTILDAGANVWRTGRAGQVALYVDAADYYASLHRNLARAERSVFILGWDIDSRLELLPGSGRGTLGAYLNALVAAREGLHVHLVLWDFNSIYLLDREAFQSIKLTFGMHPRIHFCLDDRHPLSASHHHKVVVIDDELAYCGGIDLTGNRWDTSAHEPDQPLRKNPAGKPYAPFHDCQAGVTGAPAAWLGELARERWFHATRQRLPPPEAAVAAAMGRTFDLGPALRDVPVGLARTVPAYQDQREVREVERLFTAMIDAARAYIYIENQYLTSHAICRKLAEALQRPGGPEVVLVLPKLQDSLLAKLTMGTLSLRCIDNLRAADAFGRFRAFYPEDARLAAGAYINVHAKVMIVDDRYLRIGSSNLNNRSMGLDTECDVVLDAGACPRLRGDTRHFLCRLLADHTGRDAGAARAALDGAASVADAVDALRGGTPKSLEPFAPPLSSRSRSGTLTGLLADVDLIDLDQAHPVEQLVDHFVFGTPGGGGVSVSAKLPGGLFLTCAFGLTLALGVALLPLLGDTQQLAVQSRERLALAGGGGVAVVLAAFVVGGVLFLPLNLLVVAAASLLPTWRAFVLIMAGSLLGAGAGYAVGRLLGAPALRRVFPRHAAVVRATVAKRDLSSMLLVRFFPLAPFALVNLVAGALRLRLGPFFLGTLLGMLPGAIGLVFFQKSLLQLLSEPSLGALALFVAVTALVIKGFSFLSRRFGRLADEVRHG